MEHEIDTDATPRERRRAKTRQALLDAARELTRTSGPDGWSMRELADRVDFSTTATYRYFPSKEAVLSALVDQALAQLGADLQEAVHTLTEDAAASEVVLRVALAYLDHARAYPTEFQLAFVDLPSRRASLDDAPAPQSAYAVLVDAVVDAVGRGEFQSTPTFGPEQIAFTIWSTVHGMAVLELTHLRNFAADIQGSAEDGVRRLLAGLASPPT